MSKEVLVHGGTLHRGKTRSKVGQQYCLFQARRADVVGTLRPPHNHPSSTTELHVTLSKLLTLGGPSVFSALSRDIMSTRVGCWRDYQMRQACCLAHGEGTNKGWVLLFPSIQSPLRALGTRLPEGTRTGVQGARPN